MSIKKSLICISLTILLLAVTITAKNLAKKKKAFLASRTKTITCSAGSVSIGSTAYTSCQGGFPGNDVGGSDPTKLLEYKLNTEKIFGDSGDWIYGGKAGPGEIPVDNTLGLVYDEIAMTYSFTKTSTTKYEVVISLKAGNGYAPYYFACMSFTSAPLAITFSTLGVDKGTGQQLSHMTYYYRPCGTIPPVCEITNPTMPDPTPVGAPTCSDYGFVKTYIDGVLTNSQACFGSFAGNGDHNPCNVNDPDNICLQTVLDSTPASTCGTWCPLEKLDTSGTNTIVGSFFTITVDDADGKTGTFTITNTTLTFPLLLTLKAANSYSAYLFTAGFNGTWSTSFNALSHATLWGRCPPQ